MKQHLYILENMLLVLIDSRSSSHCQMIFKSDSSGFSLFFLNKSLVVQALFSQTEVGCFTKLFFVFIQPCVFVTDVSIRKCAMKYSLENRCASFKFKDLLQMKNADNVSDV